MKFFIAGICGTFMAGIAQLAKAKGDQVYGCDSNVYPPMSTLLEREKIPVKEDYLAEHVVAGTDQIIIGNALSRGNPLIEHVLDNKLPFTSGPQWLHDQILNERFVVAVAGTHGKTTTSSLLAWLLHSSGIDAGYLIGGQPGNFEQSAYSGSDMLFVIEADEYDTAFFDKRSKFVHYNPHIVVLNNLEFDHADIFDNLSQIKTQFHHLVRIVPSNGHIVANADDPHIRDVLDMGCWSNVHWFSTEDATCDWYATPCNSEQSKFDIHYKGDCVLHVNWECIGIHNMQNALAAVAACHCADMKIEEAKDALKFFKPSARRLQLLFNKESLYLYEDFAHHPTAIEKTINAVKSRHPNARIVVALEPRSNTMRSDSHGDRIGSSLKLADEVHIYESSNLAWDPKEINVSGSLHVHRDSKPMVEILELSAKPNNVIICMSNSSFDGVPNKLRERLETRLV